MRDPNSIHLYNSFEQKIKDFRQNPKKYKFGSQSRFSRKFANAWNTFWFWFSVSAVVNIIAYFYFKGSVDSIDASSLIALTMLFLAIAARSYTVNHLMFDTIGNRGKFYFFHQISNRIGFFHRLMALSTLVWLYIHYQYSLVLQENITVLALIGMLILIMISALAVFRRRHHNTFENIHRYVGYTSITLLVIYYFQVNLDNGLSLIEILTKPHFIFIVFIIGMLIAPWLGVKKIKPKLVHTGPHVIGIEVEGKPSFGTYARISLANKQFHPFGDSMYHFNDMNNRTFYITPAGDRTSEVVYGANEDKFLLDNCTIKPNRHKGFMYQHAVYDHILIVVTGGGIAPIIPCLVLNDKTKIDVLWIGRQQTEEFGVELLANLTNAIGDKEIGLHILDTTDDDLKDYTNEHYIALALEAYKHYEPEVVFIMSNENFTVDMTYALHQNHIRTYGATFDS